MLMELGMNEGWIAREDVEAFSEQLNAIADSPASYETLESSEAQSPA
jgi:vacuolar-type H+-ATPase subunit I/STV1